MQPLPPLDAPVVYAMQSGQQHGPLTLRTVLDTVAAGRAPADTPVWWEGAAAWVPLDQTGALAQAGGQAPGGAASGLGAPAAYQAPAASPEEVEELEALFAEQVRKSWKYHKRVDFATRLDEVLLGALITATLDTGLVLIDVTSTGSDHYLRFEHPADRSRTTMAMTHLTPNAVAGEVLGHHASIVIGWGQRVAGAGEVVRAIKEEVKSNLAQTPEPGTVTIDGDVTSGYAYTQIDLIWALEDFVRTDYTVDTDRLNRHVAAAVHSLRKYWYGRFNPATS